MVANGVDVFFHGHDHIFAMEELDGIVYLECPKPDDAGYDWQPYGYGYTEGLYPDGYLLPNSGHIRVTVSPTEATIEYVRAYLPGDGTNGQVAYSYTIAAPTTYGLTMAVDPAGSGTTDPAIGVHPYAEGVSVPITATPSAGYVFDHWTGIVADPNAVSTSVTMDGDKTVTAHFTPESGISGDVNSGNAVNSTDALIILSCDVGMDTSQYCPMNCGDVNSDGFVNSTDALIILSYDVGMTVPYPVGEPGCPSNVTPCAGCTP